MDGRTDAARVLELVCGVLAAVAGALGLGYAVLGQTVRTATGTTSTQSVSPAGIGGGTTSATSTSTASLVQVGLPPGAAAFLALAVLCALAAAGGAYFHARRDSPRGFAVLGAAVALLRSVVVLFGFSLGVFLIPAWLLGVAALLSGLVVSLRTPSPATERQSRAAGIARGVGLGSLFGLAAESAALSTLPLLGLAGRGGGPLPAYAFYAAVLASPACAAVGGLAGAALAAWRLASGRGTSR